MNLVKADTEEKNTDAICRNLEVMNDLCDMKMHTGENSYKCKFCQKSFESGCSWRRDLRSHTGEKPFKCQLCEKTFERSNDLTCHIRIHNGEKLYK